MESYRNFMETRSDPRTKDWWMMSGPGPLFFLLISYLSFSIYIGPKYMKHRKPYKLKNIILFYNITQVLQSIFIVYEGLQAGWLRDYSFTCQPVDYSPTGDRMAAAAWWYFLAKIIELSDTVFFVLRKKNNQISFLHIYHHTLMPFASWIGVKFLPGGHGTFLGIINSFIHIIMYTYYLIAGLGPQYQKFLWWKPYITQLQLVQFVMIFIHGVQILPTDCNYPKFIIMLLAANCVLFLYLFGSFYVKTYVLDALRKSEIEKNHQSEDLNATIQEPNRLKQN